VPVPDLRDVVVQLRRAADLLDASPPHDRKLADVALCRCLQCTAELLAARGWPSSTLGSGSRSSDTTSSTERAAGVDSPSRHPRLPQFADLDVTLAAQLRALGQGSDALIGLVATLRSHASDEDPTPAGTGNCGACERFCRPTADRPDNRLTVGYCPTCSVAWYRWRAKNPGCQRSDFTTWQRRKLEGRQAPLPPRQPSRHLAVAEEPQVARVEAAGRWAWVVHDRDAGPVSDGFGSEAEARAELRRMSDADPAVAEKVGAGLVDVMNRFMEGAA
jgi:hypothetical protein